MYQVSFNSLIYFLRYALDKLFIAKIKKTIYSLNTDDRVLVLTFCTFSDSFLSMYQVSFNSLIYFQIYVPEKLFIAK